MRKEILSVQADPRSPERGQYAFLQDIVKHVAYETISKKERKTKHLAAAQFLSSVWSAEEDEIVEVVAAHYLDAYQAGPDDAGRRGDPLDGARDARPGRRSVRRRSGRTRRRNARSSARSS